MVYVIGQAVKADNFGIFSTVELHWQAVVMTPWVLLRPVNSRQKAHISLHLRVAPVAAEQRHSQAGFAVYVVTVAKTHDALSFIEEFIAVHTLNSCHLFLIGCSVSIRLIRSNGSFYTTECQHHLWERHDGLSSGYLKTFSVDLAAYDGGVLWS